MKRVSTFLIISFLFILSCEDSNVERSNTFFSTFGPFIGIVVKQIESGDYITLGNKPDNYGESDIWLIKTDSQGNEVWSKTFGGDQDDRGEYFEKTNDGGYIILGNTYSFGNGESDIWLIKTDSQGNEVWSKTFGGNTHDVSGMVQQTKDGGYIISGGTLTYDIWLIKTDSQGNEEWNKIFDEDGLEVGLSVRETPDMGYIVSGYSRLSPGYKDDVILIKTDSMGNEEWKKTLINSNREMGKYIINTTDGGYLITGPSFKYGDDNNPILNALLIKINSQGNEEWRKIFGGDDSDSSHQVQLTSDGGYILVGYTRSYGFIKDGKLKKSVWLIKTDNQGNEEWNKTFGESHSEGHSVDQTLDGGYVVTGDIHVYDTSQRELFLIKTDSEGNIK